MTRSRSPLRVALLICFLALGPAPAAVAETAPPHPPCAPGGAVYPDYGPEGGPPQVAVWHDFELTPAAACNSRLQGRLDLVVAFSARFRHAGSLDDLATRAGAISKTVGITYWSTTEQKWRRLITGATALTGPDGNWHAGSKWRPDFSAAELRSGKQLWFLQNDTRSTGANLYRLRALQSEPDRLVVEIVNESPISFAFVTLFGEHELLSLQVIERLEGDLWGYYSLSGVRELAVSDYEKSLINRAAAYYRFLLGRPGDSAPPLAR